MFIAPTASVALTIALDIADKLIKLAAVALGGVWTFWNFHKSRTYAAKLDLELTANATPILYGRGYLHIYVNVDTKVTNIGSTRSSINHELTKCTVKSVRDDLREVPERIFPVFAHQDNLEPGESTNDVKFWRIESRSADITWLKIELFVFSDEEELQWKAVLGLPVRAQEIP
jgi:hypothetical protein